MENFDNRVFIMKGYLMSGKPKNVMSCINWIKEQFDIATDQQKEEILMKLINYNFVDQFYEQLITCKPTLRYKMIEIVKRFSECQSFYKTQRNLLPAFNAILKIAEVSFNNSETHVLEATISTLLLIINRCENYEIPLVDFLRPRNILSILKKLEEKKVAYSVLISAAQILYSILRDNSLEIITERELLLSVLKHFLEKLQEYVAVFEPTGWKTIDTVIELILKICETCIVFNDKDDKANSEGCCSNMRPRQASARGETLTISSLVNSTVLGFIVPRIKSYGYKPETEVFKNFLYCLNQIFETEKEDKYEFANSISSYGYLTYFLELQGNVELGEMIKKLLGKIMNCLLTEMFPANTMKTNDEDALKNIILRISLLPNNPSELRRLITTVGPLGDGLSLLCYIHFLKTDEIYLYSFQSTLTKLIQFTAVTAVSGFVAKALWLLLAVTAKFPCDLPDYTLGMEKLNDFLVLPENCINCYTHHSALLMYCLQEANLSSRVRAKVVELWLKNSNGDISEILKSDDTDILTRDFVIAGIFENPLDIIKTIMTIVNETKQGSSSQLTWKGLEYYTNQGCHEGSRLIMLLENTYDSDTDGIKTQDLKAGAKSMRNIICSDAESETRVLALCVFCVVLEEMRRRRDIEIFQLFSEDTQLLKKLKHFSLIESERNYALKCIFLLLVTCQDLSITRTSAAVTFSADEIFHMLVRMDINPHRSLVALELLNFCLSDKTESAVVKIDFAPKQDVSISDLVMAVAIMHGEVLTLEYSKIYLCLISLLQFSKEWKASELPELVQMLCVDSMVRDVIEERIESQEFLDFLITWLQCRKECGEKVYEDILRVLSEFLQSLAIDANVNLPIDKLNTLKSLVEELSYVWSESIEPNSI